MTAQTLPRPTVFHGWRVVAAAFALQFVGFGTAYSFAAFFHSLRDEFQATRGDISLVFAITGFLYFGLGAISGPVADRIGPRRVLLTGVSLISIGLLLASGAQELWQIYLTYSLGVGVGVGLVYVPAVGAVQRWFSRRRGMASGLAVAGIGAGTLVMPLLAAALIDLTNWRVAYAVLAAITLIIGLPAALVVEHSPERKGQRADGDAPHPAGTPAPQTVGSTLGEAVRSRPFRLLYVSGFSASIGIFIPFAHLAPYARDHGFTDGFGALLVGLIGVGSVAGRLGLGGSADRIGRRVALGSAFVGMGISLFAWLGATEAWSLTIFALAFGASYGGFVALMPALSTDYFGGRNAGGIIGLLFTGAAFGALVGPTLAGAVFDARDSYTLPILLGVAMNGVAIICMALIPSPERWRAAQG